MNNWQRLPGMRLILLGLATLLLTCLWPIFFHWGIPLPKSLTARIGGTFGTLFLIWGTLSFSRWFKTKSLLHPFELIVSRMWQVLIAMLLGVGIILGNGIFTSIREFVFFLMLVQFLFVGVDDRFWYAIEKPLTFIFYVAVPLVLLFYNTPTLIVGSKGVAYSRFAEIGGRYTWSLAFELRPLIAFGAFLGIWGFVRPSGGLWRIAQMLAPIFYFIVEVGLFQFRSAAFSILLMLVSVVFFRPLLETHRRRKFSVMLLSVIVAGIVVFMASDAYDVFKHRSFESTHADKPFQSRINELYAYIDDMGWTVAVGRGLGGSFDASAVYANRDSAKEWKVLHFGILVFTLKGGILMFMLFFMFLWPGFILRPKSWYNNPCNLTAALYFPVVIFQILVNPISITPVALFKYMPVMMVLSRFARKMNIESVRQVQNSSERQCPPSQLASCGEHIP